MPLKCTDYFCPTDGSCIKRPIVADGMAPFVRIKFPPIPSGKGTAGGNTITTIDRAGKPDLTVGNNSNSPNNHACIKSFQYGASDGNGAEVEIFDEEGGAVDLFINKLVKVLGDANDFGCNVEWGWALSNCDDGGRKTINQKIIKSSTHFFLINSINIRYSAGGILFKLELQDVMEPLFETRVADVIPDVTLKKAIITLLTERANPKIKSVLFKRFTPSAGGQAPCNNLINNNQLGNQSNQVDMTKLQDFKFKGDMETKKANWECKGETPLAIIRSWLVNKMTENDKGTIIFWNSSSADSELVIMEDPLPKCWKDKASEDCSQSLGTYIVNGGANSPVLSFEPQIKFNFATAAKSGAGVDTQTAQGVKAKPANPCPENSGNNRGGGNTPVGSGDTTFIQMDEPFNQIYGPGNIKLALRGVSANEKANKTYDNLEAELRIQGDPSLDNPNTIKVKTVSILVINPFHLRNAGNKDFCPEWLVGPPCNQILSNKNWFIKGVSHEIKEGSYTTTLKIYLPQAGETVKP